MGRPAPEGPAADDRRAVEGPDEGGEAACMAALVCPGCGAVAGDGPHRPGCPDAGG